MRDDELDPLIDGALTTYGKPRSGLEMRILNRVTAAQEAEANRPRHRWLVWALAMPLAACVMLLITLPTKRQAHSNVAPQTYEQSHHPIATVQRPHPEALPVLPRRRSEGPQPVRSSTIARTASIPKLDVFPSPQPLSKQEQALVALASQPDLSAAQQALADAKKQDDKPLEIATIHIAPITTPDEGNN